MNKADKLRLILPSLEMKNRAMAFREAFFAAGEKKVYGSCGLHNYESFEDLLMDTRITKANMLPATTYFAIRTIDNAIVGATNIRHYLDEERYYNGHIGYSVDPRERRKGYGKEILRLALIKTIELGILEPVVSCNKKNIASKRVIVGNGLSFEREFVEHNGNIVLIYVKR